MAQEDVDTLYARIGRAIHEARRQHGLTQAELSSAVGLTRTSISNIEKGRQKILLHTFFEIARALGIDPAQLVLHGSSASTPAVIPKFPEGLPHKERAFIEAGIGVRKEG